MKPFEAQGCGKEKGYLQEARAGCGACIECKANLKCKACLCLSCGITSTWPYLKQAAFRKCDIWLYKHFTITSCFDRENAEIKSLAVLCL